MFNKIWVYKNVDEKLNKELMSKYSLSELCSSVLQNRLDVVGGNVDNMFKRVIYNLHNPYLLNDMDKAVSRIKSAIFNNEKITIYGDYDADGITSTSILYMCLKDLNAIVDYVVPSRFNGGYGMNKASLDTISKSGTKLIVTVDNGISAYDEIEYAKSLGMDVVVTDHHECPDILPKCVAVINPKRKDSTYPFSELAGVGVTFKLISALSDKSIESIIKKYIFITSIGTIGDIVPLCDENRAIVTMGLKMIPYINNEGLKKLLYEKGNTDIGLADISFGLVPKLNAAGRLDDASICIEMITTNDHNHSLKIASTLCQLNSQRQETERQITEEAYKLIEENSLQNDNVIVVCGKDWHIGVIGIVASRVCEKYYKPCVILTNEEGLAKGSGRSIKEFDLFNALSSCSDVLIKFGGHSLAAGMETEIDNVDLFRKRINEYAENNVKDNDLVPKIYIDSILKDNQLNIETIQSTEILEPYGIGNPKPVYALLNAKVNRVTYISDGKHIKMLLQVNNSYIDAIGFNMGFTFQNIKQNDVVDIAGNLNINTFNGTQRPQIILCDIKNHINGD